MKTPLFKPAFEMTPDVLARAARIKLALFDVDGVLTDGRVILGANDEYKCFDIKDGHGLRMLAIKDLIGKVHDPDEMQNQLYETAKKVGLVNADGKPSRDAFSAIYLAFIGRPNGPKAGSLLTSLDPEFVRRRLDEMGRP